MPILDWNYKWDLSSSSLCDSRKSSSSYFQMPSIKSNQEQDLTFASKLQSIKIEPPDTYPEYTGTNTFDLNSTKIKSTSFQPSNQIKFREWNPNSEFGFNFDEYVSIQPSPQTQWSQSFENNVRQDVDKYVNFSQTKLENGTPAFSNTSVIDHFNDFTPLSQMKTCEWSHNPANRYDSENYHSKSNLLNINDNFTDLSNIWPVTGPTVKQEYDDDVRLLELYTPNNGQYRMDFYQSGLAESNSGRQFLNDNMNDISNDSVELLFERAGLDELMQNSPNQLLQIKELDDLVSDQPLPMDRKVKEEIIELEVINPVTFNRKHYKCSYCAFNTNGRARLTEHIERIHSETENSMRNTRRRQTRSRNSVEKVNFSFLEQESTARSKEKSFKCSECPYTTNHSERLKRHIEKKHYIETYNRYNAWEKDSKGPPPIFEKENINLKQKQPKSGSKPHKCPQCPYRAHRNDRLKQHIAKIHSKNVCFKCSQCAFESTYNRDYYEHMKSHYDGPPFRCDACAYKSKLITAFIAHRVTHTGDRLFNCTLCSFSCKRKYHLKGHMISHSKEKAFLCEHCNKRYSYRCSLVRHWNTSCKRQPLKLN